MQQPIQQAHLQVNSDLNALTELLAWFDQFNAPPLNYQTWLQCQLALAEGFTNAVRHAHHGRSPNLSIDVDVRLYAERLEIRIWDWGPPFDLVARLSVMPQELGSFAEGGRGLRLMERIADELSYTRDTPERNCLLLVKQYPANGTTATDATDAGAAAAEDAIAPPLYEYESDVR